VSTAPRYISFRYPRLQGQWPNSA